MPTKIRSEESASEHPLRTKRRRSSRQLTTQDWVSAAAQLLAHKGIGAVRVEPLAAKLGVTKGSFYHHFVDRRALHQAILDDWRRRATRGVIRRLNDRSTSAEDRIRGILELPDRSSRSVEGANLELAIRVWAQSDRVAQQVMQEVDQHRLEYLRALFEEIGLPREEAQIRAFLAYAATMGQAIFSNFESDSLGENIARHLTKK